MMTRRTLLLGASAAFAAPPEVRLDDRKGQEVRFLAGERLLFAYRYAADHPKTYVHPLCAPDGTVITQDGPKDHVHHRGLMMAWSGVDGIDFWGEVNPVRHGQIVHESLKLLDGGIEAVNVWQAEGRTLLRERRIIRVPHVPRDVTLLDWDSTLEAPEDIRLGTNGHVYDGLGVRVVDSMNLGDVMNSNGTTEVKTANGEPASWCAYQGKVASGNAGIAIFDHPENPRHPSPFFVMADPFGYLSAAPTFKEDLYLKKGGSIRFRWRVAVWNGTGDPKRWIASAGGWR